MDLAEELRSQNEELLDLAQRLETQRALLETVIHQIPAGDAIADALTGK